MRRNIPNPIIRRKWTKKYGFRYYFVWRQKNSPMFPSIADAEAGRRSAQKNEVDSHT